MKRPLVVTVVVAAFILSMFSLNLSANTGDQKVSFIILQVNDVYEITPVSGEGGLARLATLKKQLLAENPNTYMILSGDLFSPSALGTAKVNGVRLSGKQIVDSFNYAGLDFSTLGNHEFDLKADEFTQRLAESKAKWIVSNATDPQGNLFPNTLANYILTVTDTDQEIAKVGLFGVLLNSNPKDYVKYSDALTTAAQEVATLDPQVDMIVAITHLAVSQDRQLASQQPNIDLILGGHEHENMAVEVDANSPTIYKADANARSAYIHRITYYLDTKKLDIQSELKRLTADIPDDPEVAKVVNNWVKIAYDGFRKDGFESEMVVADIPIPLDGLENSVRNRPTELTKALAETMRLVMPGAELAFFNGGSIRIDDVLPAGKLTQYDVIRILPFGGLAVSIDIKGSVLQQVLGAGRNNAGNGGYIQTAGVSLVNNIWLINDQPLDSERIYRAVVNDFLLTGKEGGLGFFNRNNPDVKVIAEGPDLRQAFIKEMQRRYAKVEAVQQPVVIPSANIKIALKADTSNYLARCNGCVPNGKVDNAAIHAKTPATYAQFTLEKLPNGKYALKADNEKYLSRCHNCIPGGAYLDSATVHVKAEELLGAPYAQFDLAQLKNGKYTLRADTGMYLGRCNGCVPRGAYADNAFIHVTEDKVQTAPWAQWDIVIIP